MKVMSFLFLFLLSSISFAGEDTVKCYSTPALNNPEIEKLFSMIKNDVLGVVPKFCRPNGPEQIGDNEQGSKDLTKFVDALKSSNPNGEDVIEVISGDNSKLDAVIFTVVKMVIQKKMWNQLKEEDQYSLLLERDCVGLNRFEMHKTPQKIIDMKPSESKEAFNRALVFCRAESLSSLARYITKDILAESLLTLKTILPHTFPQAMNNLCEILSISDEAIFKNDEYKSFLTAERNISTVDDFSIWLKSVYANTKVTPEYSYSLSKKEEDKKLQVILKKEFEAHYDPKLKMNSVKTPNGVTVYKNSQGKFFQLSQKESMSKEYEKETDEYVVKRTNRIFEETQEKLKNIYENRDKKPVALPNYPEVKIIKGDDGIYRYEISTAEKERINKLINDHKRDQNAANENIIRKASNQRVFKKIYENEIAVKDMENPRIILSVIKDKDGIYRDNPELRKDVTQKISLNLIQKLSTDKDSLFIPSIDDKGGVILSGDSELPLEDARGTIPIKVLEPSPTKVYKSYSMSRDDGYDYFEMLVNMTIEKQYQKKNINTDKMSSLDKSSIEEVQNYTGKGYKDLNECLRNSNCSFFQNRRIKKINQIIDQIKKEKAQTDYQIVFRGAAALTDQMKADLKKNPQGFVMDKAFMSTSGSSAIATKFQTGAIFILKVKSCASIAGFSKVLWEDEFLCPPGIKFNVRQRERKDTGPIVYILEEAE